MIEDEMSKLFWKHVDKTDDCWLWTGSLDADGYGRFGGTSCHRYIYSHMKGTIASGMEIDHLCRVKNCVNPEHLEQVTHAENIKRAVPFRKPIVVRDKRTHCLQGHEYTPENTISLYFGGRMCRECYESSVRKKVIQIREQ